MAVIVSVRTPGRQPVSILIDARLEFGRESSGFLVGDTRVSRRHVALAPSEGGGVVVTDLGSSNGTKLDGITISGPTPAGPGATVTIGDTTILVMGDHKAPTGASLTEMRLAPEQETSIERVAASVSSDAWQPAVLGVHDEPGTLTVMFSDIEGSTQRAVGLGDQAWYALLQRHSELVTAHIAAHRGRIVKHQGDGFMCCFRSARSSLLASIGIQRDLARQAELEPQNAVAVRIGMHTGEVLVADDGDLFGKHVMVAARIAGAATGGEILVSSLVHQIAEPRGDISFVSPASIELKGIGGTETVWSVDWKAFLEARR